jgi:ribosomal protein S12 methylthiotransferase
MTRKKIWLVSLGCPKNLVDSEVLLCAAVEEGWAIAPDPRDADLVVVNTCGFVDEARRESLQCIRECLRVRRRAGRPAVVVAGCMSQLPEGSPTALPRGVDHVIGVGEVERFRDIVAGRPGGRRGRAGRRTLFPDERHPRLLTGYGHSTYLKIGDGCSRTCSFCLIPSIRGKGRSRDAQAIVDEAAHLASLGVKEIILVSQDTTAYGRDLARGGADLVRLLEMLSGVDGIAWLRVLYLYPRPDLHGLFELMRDRPVMAPYLDLPVQHASDRMLGIMRRGYGRKLVEELVSAARRAVPGLAVRTTLIVGHPGETGKDFDELLAFLDEMSFERIGIMAYSDERGTPAHGMAGKVSPALLRRRFDRAVDRASRILRRQSLKLVGTRRAVMLDAPARGCWLGRLSTQAPDIDGAVRIRGVPPGLGGGDLVDVEITGVRGVDLLGRFVSLPRPPQNM